MACEETHPQKTRGESRGRLSRRREGDSEQEWKSSSFNRRPPWKEKENQV